MLRVETGRAARILRIANPVLSTAAFIILMLSRPAEASGPRWVTGPPYFDTISQPVIWYTLSPLYFTDPGDLSAYVNHAAADALVAAAADVWNVPTSGLTLAQGGELAEHVSSANVYLGPNGLVFPADVSSANYMAIQIPVIYDSDGSVTDLLLGQGASDPENCLQNGVTESVDAISRSGTIQHALLILNGRCTGPAPEQQLQLQYQLMRAFGRVIGLGWSQTNDNVFTDLPPPTNQETLKWPIMHPIDIVCGDYTYQCLPSAFTLRPDDIASISQLYFIAKGAAPAGKVDTLSHADAITGTMSFGDGQGMQGMNLLVRRANPPAAYLEDGPAVSTVTGNLFRWNNGNPVTGPPSLTVDASMGAATPVEEGGFQFGVIPLLQGVSLQDAFMTSEPVNPLYTGVYGLGPYPNAPVAPSGPAFPWRDNGVVPYEANYYVWTVPGSTATCTAANLGTAATPVPVPATGWWTDTLCGYGVSAWSSVAVQANRSLTVEVTALDEAGEVTENKLQPLVGLWRLADPAGVLPTLAATFSPFNSIAAGLSSLNFQTEVAGPLRLVITDQNGDGRPDYNFRARVLYADSILPATVPPGGGLVTLTGLGFRPGNQVNFDGVSGPVVSSTATTVLAIAPPFAALPAGSGLAVDVGVTDLMTGGSAYMFGALSYPAISLPSQSPALTVLTPKYYLAAGVAVALSPQVGLSDAGVAAAGVPVTWSAVSGALTFRSGSPSTSTSNSDSDTNGVATITATAGPLPAAAEAVGSACAFTGVCGNFTVLGVGPSLWTPAAIEGAAQSIASSGVLQPVVFQITDGAGDRVVGASAGIYQTITGFEVCPAQGRCPAAPVYQSSQAAAVSDVNGLVTVTPLQLTGSPEVTTIAVSTGTQGFVSITLEKQP